MPKTNPYYLEKRNERIDTLLREGLLIKDVARVLGISRQRVHQILKKRREAVENSKKV